MNNPSYVWYACYGSNLLKERFLRYIKGGKFDRLEKYYAGCYCKDDPIDDKCIAIPFLLYFAEYSKVWNGSVAFLNPKYQNITRITLGRRYLITSSQFSDIFAQENNVDSCSINFEKVIMTGSYEYLPRKWYGKIIYLGHKDGHPCFTFTSSSIRKKPKIISQLYLETMLRGLRDKYGLSKKEFINYIADKHGIKENLSQFNLDY